MIDRSSSAGMFDTIAARINTSSGGARSIGFTGAVAGEGVSTVALGTAAALANVQSGPILFVDANQIDRGVTIDAAALDAPGLVGCLRGTVQARAAVIATAQPNIFLLPAGLAEDRTPLGELTPVLNSLLNDFRYVVVDLPPVLAATALVTSWSALLDRLFLVTRADTGRVRLVRTALAALRPVTTPALILNAAEREDAREAVRAYA